MKYLIIIVFGLVAIAADHGTQREIRVNGDRRIYIHSNRKIVTIFSPDYEPRNLKLVVKNLEEQQVQVIEMDESKNVIRRFSFEAGHYSDADKEVNRKEETSQSNTQIEFLVKVFRKYQGVVGEQQFYQLLKEIKDLTERQEISSIVYDILKDLEVKPQQGSFDDISTQKQYSNEAEKQHIEAQIEWIQKLLKHQSSSPGDITNGQIDDFFQSIDYVRTSKDAFLKETMLQFQIQDLQRQIIENQKKAEQLQVLGQFLEMQKQRLNLLRDSKYGLPEENQKVSQHVRRQQIKLIEQQLDIQQTTELLQERLKNHLRELKALLKNDQ